MSDLHKSDKSPSVSKAHGSGQIFTFHISQYIASQMGRKIANFLCDLFDPANRSPNLSEAPFSPGPQSSVRVDASQFG